MEGGVDPQGGLDPQRGQQSESELDIYALQAKIPSQIGGVQFESTFYKPMMIEIAFTDGPSIQPSYTKLAFFRPAYSQPTYTKVPSPYASLTPDHALGWTYQLRLAQLVLVWRSWWLEISTSTLWRIEWINIRVASLISLSIYSRGLIVLRIACSVIMRTPPQP